jgi:hypothetical protein
MSKSYVPAVRGNRKLKIFPDDLSRIYKLARRETPKIPSFSGKHKKELETDIDSETG